MLLFYVASIFMRLSTSEPLLLTTCNYGLEKRVREEGFTAIGQRRSKYRLVAWFAEGSSRVLLPLA
jgi:hypothetical protein